MYNIGVVQLLSFVIFQFTSLSLKILMRCGSSNVCELTDHKSVVHCVQCVNLKILAYLHTIKFELFELLMV